MSLTKVCVTGASGYIGGFVVEEFLRAGFTVNATVRNPDASTNDFLRELAAQLEPETGCSLRLFGADLLREGSFDDAVEGCHVVVHVAGIVQNWYDKDPMAEVVDPNVSGMKNVIASCKKHGVRRIVFTSSTAIIAAVEARRDVAMRGKPLTEDQVLTHVTPTYGTYNYAKIEAEKALAELWDGEAVSLLCAWAIGPLNGPRISSSQRLCRALIFKEYGLCPPQSFHWVDVRDVARAHMFAATKLDLPSGRYLVSATDHAVPCKEMAMLLNRIDPTLKLPTTVIPWSVLWAQSWFDKKVTKFFLEEGVVPLAQLDTSRMREAGFVFVHKDLKLTLQELLASYRAFGIARGGGERAAAAAAPPDGLASPSKPAAPASVATLVP